MLTAKPLGSAGSSSWDSGQCAALKCIRCHWDVLVLALPVGSGKPLVADLAPYIDENHDCVAVSDRAPSQGAAAGSRVVDIVLNVSGSSVGY